MRFHVPCLPHTLPTKEYLHCAYTQKLLNFAVMMRKRGHEVFLYESNEPFKPEDNLTLKWDVNDELWQRQNQRAIEGIKRNIKPQDFIAIIGGLCQQPIAQAFPEHLSVEFGVGYYGIFSDYCVFESYFHMSNVYGDKKWKEGRFFDTVIPNYYDLQDFPIVYEPDDYVLFVGRLNHDKGIQIAANAAKVAGVKLVVCGQGTAPAKCYYEGVVGVEERAALMSHAKALICPTLYLEPFGGVAVEAQLCGTPVISTDWGAFTETVEQGKTGFRCHYFGEFVDAIKNVDALNRKYIAKRARKLYSLETVGEQYENYFKRLELLWHDGWNAVGV